MPFLMSSADSTWECYVLESALSSCIVTCVCLLKRLQVLQFHGKMPTVHTLSCLYEF